MYGQSFKQPNIYIRLYPPTLTQQLFIVCIDNPILPWIINQNIQLIIDIPTPTIVIHRPQIHIPPITQITFRMQKSFSSFIHLQPILPQSPKQHIIIHTFKHILITI